MQLVVVRSGNASRRLRIIVDIERTLVGKLRDTFHELLIFAFAPLGLLSLAVGFLL